MEKKVSSVLYTKEQIEDRVNELAKQIENDYVGRELIFVCILSGSMMFASDLVRKISDKVFVRIDVLSASSYDKTESTGKVFINMDVKADLQDKDVIVVEDIIDTGNTIDYIIYHLKYRNPRSLKICSFLDKPKRRAEGIEIKIDYLGFEIPDHFVVGYGLDYEQQYRNLPYIGILSN
jgi:hypoxanthine phosphoribosyltransferase